jgi:hypothetical protein
MRTVLLVALVLVTIGVRPAPAQEGGALRVFLAS